MESGLVIIGEAPGAAEETQGRPFVGRSGRHLDRMLDYLELKRELVYITNAVKVRPEGNRTPTDQEIDSWRQPLFDEVLNADVWGERKVALALGTVAAKAVLGVQGFRSLSYYRGQVLEEVSGFGDVIVTYHPAYLLRNPKAIPESKKDLDLVKAHLLYLEKKKEKQWQKLKNALTKKMSS